MNYDSNLTAHTKHGDYVGKRNEAGTIVFRGIPYAKYVGRWQPLEPLPEGAGTFEAYENGPACPQITYSDWYGSAKTVKKDETACYSLCVASSELSGSKPVFVFIHGGANITGGYFDPRYDLQHFVDRNPDIVFVVFNYRLGPLGTLYLNDITDDPKYRYAGNLTLLDQLAAFRWVHENIAAFGGNPNSVTIAGRSSGSASATYHTCIPESWKYWNRVFAQSGTTFHSKPKTPAQATAATKGYMEKLGVSTLDELLALSTDELLSKFSIDTGITFTADGITLPLDLNETICAGGEGLTSGKDIMISCANGDMDGLIMDPKDYAKTRKISTLASSDIVSAVTDGELPYYLAEYFPGEDPKLAAKFLKGFTPADSDRLFDIYAERYPNANPFFPVSDATNDLSMENPLILECNGMSKHNRVFHYIWTWAPENILPFRGYHGIDAPFMLNTRAEDEKIYDSFGTPEADRMFDVAQTMMCNFIRTGSPDTPELKAIPYDSESRATMLVDLQPSYQKDPRACDRDLFIKLYHEWLEKNN